MSVGVIIVMIVHVLVSVALVVAILLHSGKGTGLSTTLGGGMSQFTGTTVVERYLDRITIGLSLVFLVTTIILVISLR